MRSLNSVLFTPELGGACAGLLRADIVLGRCHDIVSGLDLFKHSAESVVADMAQVLVQPLDILKGSAANLFAQFTVLLHGLRHRDWRGITFFFSNTITPIVGFFQDLGGLNIFPVVPKTKPKGKGKGNQNQPDEKKKNEDLREKAKNWKVPVDGIWAALEMFWFSVLSFL